MTTLPTWAVWLVSVGTPVVTFLGVLLAQFIARKADRELEIRSRREETMRVLRWAAELSAERDDRLADLGVAELSALLRSDLLEEPEKVFVEAALDAVYDDVAAELDELGAEAEVVQEGQDVQVQDDDGRPDDSRGVSSSPGDGGEGHG